MVYNPEFPPGESITETFSREYYLEDHANAFEDQLEDYRADPSTPAFERGLDEIEKLLGGRVGILDVGCAFGTFLRLAANRGWAAKGVEISGFASEIARERGGLEVFNGELSAAPFPEASFDAITFWDVVEHVSWPFDALVSAYRLLRPGGVLLLTTDATADRAIPLPRAAGLTLRRTRPVRPGSWHGVPEIDPVAGRK